MPVFGKSILSRHLRTSCDRLARLNLHPDEEERSALRMPPPDPERPSSNTTKSLGDEWERKKLAEIREVMGRHRLREFFNPDGTHRPVDVDDEAMLGSARPGDFLAQARFKVAGGSFARANGLDVLERRFGLKCEEAVPDLILVHAPGTYSHGVLPNGAVEELSSGDPRFQLRVIDIKLTEHPGAAYFAEVAYYMMALAGHLEDVGLDRRFVVVPPGAIWPGSHDQSALRAMQSKGVTDHALLLAALEGELVEAPFSVFAPRIRQFIRGDLPRLLKADWRDLGWHVDHRCQGCEFLGFDWHPNRKRSVGDRLRRSQYCMQQAACDGKHLSQIPFLPRGARVAMEGHGIATVEHVAQAAAWAEMVPQALVNEEDRYYQAQSGRIFKEHRALATSLPIVRERAIALTTPGYQARIAPGTRTSAVMPRWSGLKVYLTADFDVSSGITLAFGVSALWSQDYHDYREARLADMAAQVAAKAPLADPGLPLEEGADRPEDAMEPPQEVERRVSQVRREVHPGAPGRDWHHWPAEVFVVDRNSANDEFQQLLALLRHIDEILADGRVQAGPAKMASTWQVYIWDKGTYDHLRRVVGRHWEGLKGEGRKLSHVYDIFPPEGHLPEEHVVTRNSPYTIVKEVVAHSLAAPVPHFYSLLNTARHYNLIRDPEAARRMLRVNRFFEDPLSDHIPSERAHEIWEGVKGWEKRCEQLETTVRKQLFALSQVTERLERDLRPVLTANAPEAPDLTARRDDDDDMADPEGFGEVAADGVKPKREISADGEMLLRFGGLNVAYSKLEIDTTRAMPVSEREARGRSARLERRLGPREEAEALASLGLPHKLGRRVYRLAPASKDVAARPDAIDWCLAPEGVVGFLDRSVKGWFQAKGMEVPEEAKLFKGQRGSARMEDVTNVSLVAIDRNRRLLVVDSKVARLKGGGEEGEGEDIVALDFLEQTGECDLSRDVVLDRMHVDLFLPKLRAAVGRVGNPDVAKRRCVSKRLLAGGHLPLPTAPASGANPPVAEIIWNAKALEAATSSEPEKHVGRFKLNESQRQAFLLALKRRLHLIWGPPGTGKSHTIGAIIAAAFLERLDRRDRMRVLVVSSTWTATDNILKELPAKLADAMPDGPGVVIKRVRSALAKPPGQDCAPFDLVLDPKQESADAKELRRRLTQPFGSRADASMLEFTVVGATAHQVYNLVNYCKRKGGSDRLFDLVIIDEGSQMDVATALVSLLGLSSQGKVVVAGDWLQLSPVHQADAPEALRPMLGSIYDYLRLVHGVQQTALAVNHRSNAEIVGFCRQAGYETLTAHSPRMRVRFDGRLPKDRPGWWPRDLAWSPAWRDLLDPERPLTAYVYPDGRSNQASPFEAHAVAALVLLLSRHMLKGLSGVRRPDGTPVPVGDTPWSEDPEGFWRHGVGIVTPHRAQQALVVAELQKHFPPELHDLIRGAVDTVERFQGQERDVMLASYAMGDPDAIAGEAEFLYSLNRFNVMASRPRAKFIVIQSQEVVDHLPNDAEVLDQARLLKLYAETPEDNRAPMALPWADAEGTVREVHGSYRWHDANMHGGAPPSRRLAAPDVKTHLAPAMAEPEPLVGAGGGDGAVADLFGDGFDL